MNDSANPASKHKRSVLFLCTGNSCRSQMAEGWTRHLHGDLFDVYSAGTDPHAVDARAIAAMAEVGVDISGQRSKHVDELMNLPFDLIVTVCDGARESCPFFHGGGTKINRSFEDPPYLARDASDEDETMSHYRRIRDEIRGFIIDLPNLF